MAGRRYIQSLLKRPILAFLAVSIPVYVAAFFVLRPDVDPVTWEAGEIADHLLHRQGFSMSRFAGHPQVSANQEPVYPYLLAVFRQSVPFPYRSLLVLQVIVWLWAAGLLGRLARHWLGVPATGVAIAAAVWPPLVVYVLSYHPFFLRASSLVLVLATLTAYRRGPSFRGALAVGVALGVAALLRATYLALPVVVLAWMLVPGPIRNPDDFDDVEPLPTWHPMLFRLAHGAVALALMGAVLAPWTIRNHRQLGAWVPITTSGGYTARIGNHAGANGAMDDAAVRDAFAGLSEEFWKQGEPARDREHWRAVRTFWIAHPGESILLYARKLAYLWTWRPGVGERYTRWWTPVYLGVWLLILPLVGLGVWSARHNPYAYEVWLPLSVCVFLSLLYAVFAVNMRFRFEYEALLLPCALAGVGYLRARIRRRER